jgi:hypothetical protein
VRAGPRLCELYPGIYLTTEKKQKNVRVVEKCPDMPVVVVQYAFTHKQYTGQHSEPYPHHLLCAVIFELWVTDKLRLRRESTCVFLVVHALASHWSMLIRQLLNTPATLVRNAHFFLLRCVVFSLLLINKTDLRL